MTDSENYYAIRDGKDEFRLAETLYDTNPLTEKEVNIVGTGDTTHTFALINPQINVVRNSDIQFNLQSPTLNGYELKIYREPEFLNEYVSSFDSRDFNVQSVGTIGLGTASNASLTVNYSENVPSKLYYALEKGGYISTADKEVTVILADAQKKSEIILEDGTKLALTSKEAFNIISKAWIRSGWDTKYVYGFSWFGRPIIQLPEDIIRIQEVIYQIKPDFIITEYLSDCDKKDYTNFERFIFYNKVYNVCGKNN